MSLATEAERPAVTGVRSEAADDQNHQGGVDWGSADSGGGRNSRVGELRACEVIS